MSPLGRLAFFEALLSKGLFNNSVNGGAQRNLRDFAASLIELNETRVFILLTRNHITNLADFFGASDSMRKATGVLAFNGTSFVNLSGKRLNARSSEASRMLDTAGEFSVHHIFRNTENVMTALSSS